MNRAGLRARARRLAAALTVLLAVMLPCSAVGAAAEETLVLSYDDYEAVLAPGDTLTIYDMPFCADNTGRFSETGAPDQEYEDETGRHISLDMLEVTPSFSDVNTYGPRPGRVGVDHYVCAVTAAISARAPGTARCSYLYHQCTLYVDLGQHTVVAPRLSVTVVDADRAQEPGSCRIRTFYGISPSPQLPGAYSRLPTPTREGRVFAGWYTEAEGGRLITDENYKTDPEVAAGLVPWLYARWAPEPAEIQLPAGLTAIGSQAFAGLENAVFIVPASVTEIADDAFEPQVTIRCPANSYACDRCAELGLTVIAE